ncbi:MAG: efflux RND transporter periplasmic adaptor subunit [Deltaproteobacteria bacterium]|nr:efflux RND transporter periplasmic adaptor subunit [Deltaproteobacteria bacterium]
MKTRQIIAAILVLVVGTGVTAFVLRNAESGTTVDAKGGHADEAAASEPAAGPHGGRLLADGDFAVEVTIFERGVPPEFRVYSYAHGKSLDPPGIQLTIELYRFGGQVDRIGFTQRDDYLLGDQEITEPHSFDVKVIAERDGKTHRWEYNSYEGRAQISAQAAQNAGVVIETVGPAKLRQTLQVHGRIAANEDQMKHVIPRYPGIVKEIRKRLGNPVAKGEVLAIVESNESLQPYEVKSEQAGTVIHKDVTAGEFVKEGKAIYVVADLSSVWVDLNVYRKDFSRVKVRQSVTIDGGEGMPTAEGEIAYVSPFGAKDNQTMLARVVLPNPNGEWRPGLYVTGKVLTEEVTVPVAVKAAALQTFRDWDVVFLNEGNLFEIAILELGRRDATWVEVLSGVTAAKKYVAENSFIIKADILKSGASHDH